MTSMKRTAIRILLMACVLLGSIRSGHAGTVYIYDGFNRLIEARFDDNSWITYDYDAAGNLTGKTYFTSTESFKTITATSGEGGVVWPTSVKVALHEEQTFTITPSFGYHVAGVIVDGTSVGTPQSYTFSDVTADHAIQASFAINTYTLTATVKGGAGGSISPASATVNHGSSQTYTLTPSVGYHIVDLTVDGSSVGAVSTYTLDNITENHVLEASFSSTYTLATSVTGGEGGTVSPVSPGVPHGGSQTLTIAPAAGYCILAVSVDGTPVGAVSSYTFSNVSADHTLEATFMPCYTITTLVTGEGGGSITPSSPTIHYARSQGFTIRAAPGYTIADVSVDGVSRGSIRGYTFSSVTGNHILSATFGSLGAAVKNARSGAVYSSLQAAYNEAQNGDTLYCRDVEFTEDFAADRSISVTIDGGYLAGFSSNPNKTILIGSQAIGGGTVTLMNFIVGN